MLITLEELIYNRPSWNTYSNYIPAINATANAAVAGDNDPNNPNTIGTTFEILFIDDFTGTIKTANTADKFVGSGYTWNWCLMMEKKHLFLQQLIR